MAQPVDNGGKTDNYVWQQTAYDITLLFPLNKNKTKDIDLKFTPEKFVLKMKGELIYEGTFCFAVKCESSTWYIENDSVVIELDKFKKHEWWKSAFLGDDEIDTAKVVPATETFADLDSSTRSTIDKMMFEQEMKEKNKMFTKSF
jgi:hypothetical protein